MKAFVARRHVSRTASAIAIGLISAFVATGLLGVSGNSSTHAAPPTFTFSSGLPDGVIAMASGSAGIGPHTETADDFVVAADTGITSATFTGLLPTDPGVAGVLNVEIEFYRVFPQDSVNPPSGNVPTRVNTPSDVVFTARGTASANAAFSTSVLNASFTAANSVLNGIHSIPNQVTGGDGSVSGMEVQFAVTFTTPVVLAPGHYFFVPQVQMSSGMFMWLSAPNPVVAPGTPFAPDLQADVRNANLKPDWLRVRTDIVGGSPPTYNAVFSLSGETCVAIDVSPNPLPDGTAGSPYSQQLVGSGGVPSYTFAETGALPIGITLTAVGALAGTTSNSGSFPIAVTVTDMDGCVSTVSRSLTIAAATTTAPAPTTTVAPTTTNVATTTLAPTTTIAGATTIPSPPSMPTGALPATGNPDGHLLLIALAFISGGTLALWLSRRRGFSVGGR